MEALNSFIQSIVGSVGPFVPRIVGALVILIVTWIIAKVVKGAVTQLGRRTSLDATLKSPGISSTFANVGYWFVWLMGLPMLLGTLGLTGLLDPVNNLLSRLLGFLPNLMGAIVIFAIGFLVARIVRQIVTSLLSAAGSEKLAARLGMSSSLGKDGLAGLVGTILFVLILLPVVAGALQPLGLDSVTKPVSNMLDTIMALIPKLAGAAIIMVFAVVVGRIIANLVSSVLTGLGFNNVPARLGMAQDMRIAGRNPAELAGTIILASIVIAALTQASEVLGINALTSVIGTFGVIAAQIFSGVLVLGIGLWLANLAANAVNTSSIANAKTLGNVAKFGILFFVIPLALRQMGLPTEIVTMAFGSIMVALTIGAAIAIGVGGRHVAGRLLENAVNTFDSKQARLPEHVNGKN